jgi:hypothetical protein
LHNYHIVECPRRGESDPMTNAMTKKDYEQHKNKTYHVIEFYPEEKTGKLKRSLHTSGADLVRAMRTVQRVTGRGGRVLVFNHAVHHRAREIDPNRSERTNAPNTLYGFDFEPINALILKAYEEIRSEKGILGVR